MGRRPPRLRKSASSTQPTAEVDLAEIERFVPVEEVGVVQEVVVEEPAPVQEETPDPSFWTPRNSTCDPLWRRLLDRVLMVFH